MTLVHWSGILIILAVIDWIATVILARAALRLREPALQERATASAIMTLAATSIGVLSGAYILNIELSDGLGTAILVGALLLFSLPQVIWMIAYELGRFR